MIRFLLPGAMLLATPAAAEVVKATTVGFEVRTELTIAAPRERVWAALIKPATWWSKDHTYSGDAAKLSLDPRAGGCFCERLPNGGAVEHMRVVMLRPPGTLRLVGALGPLQQEGVQGAMTITLTSAGSGATKIVMNYVVGGYIRAGTDALAGPVDGVLALQMQGLKAAAERK